MQYEVAPKFSICKMLQRRKCRRLFISMLAFFILGLVYLGYFMCEESVCSIGKKKSQFDAYVNGHIMAESFKDEDLYRDYDFDMEGNDVIVFLHIQKTGGTTFGKHLVKNMDLDRPCECVKGKKRCYCENSRQRVWLFSRYSTGWACGLHADWTELQACVNDLLDKKEDTARVRSYYYITILRDPVNRYLSEWKHVQRGSTWLAVGLKCNGREATLKEMPFCFHDEDWSGVTLPEFMDCPYNLANNRQTRMLANLSLVGCYNRSAMPEEQRNRIMLQSAKDNLRDMAFFGLTEYQTDTQYMFEKTFHLNFKEDFVQYNDTHARSADVSESETENIMRLNKLDIELYQYAKQLFQQRLKKMRSEDKGGGRGGGGGGESSDFNMGNNNYNSVVDHKKYSPSNGKDGINFVKRFSSNALSKDKKYTDIHKYDVNVVEEDEDSDDDESVVVADIRHKTRRKHRAYS